MGRRVPTIKISTADALYAVISGITNYINQYDYQGYGFVSFLTEHEHLIKQLPDDIQNKVCRFIAIEMTSLLAYSIYETREIQNGVSIVESGQATEYDMDFVKICNVKNIWRDLAKDLKSDIGSYYVKAEEILDRVMFS